MAIYLSKEKVHEIFAKHGGSAQNSGSVESQIALFTYRIQSLSEHLKKKCQRSFLQKNLVDFGWKKKKIASLFTE